MNWRRPKQLLFSKAVLLTYIFIGYMAIAEQSAPACQVDTLPSYSTNETDFPPLRVYIVSMTEHQRPVKLLTNLQDLEAACFGDGPSVSSEWVCIRKSESPDRLRVFIVCKAPRGPPSISFLTFS